MSSYLERFATNAGNPSTLIAPLVRPVYLARPIDPEPPGSSLERPDDEARAPSPRKAMEPREARKSPSVALGALPSPPSPASPGFAPLLPERRVPDLLASAAPGEADGPASSSQPAGTPAVRPAPRETPEPRRTSGSRPDTADPRPGRVRQQPDDSRTSLVPRTRSVPTSPRALRANQAALRTADKIQIHIGRVEVVAVAPPQPQPQPAPLQRERRALRLDDYLRSGG
jgi:hypothetical protein